MIGITRVRNEELILEDTLSHFKKHCDTILLYDDCSTDKTVQLAKDCGAVVINGDKWRTDRVAENTRHRRILVEHAMGFDGDWVLCFDADERLSGPLPNLGNGAADGYTFRLFDGYMTEVCDAPYQSGDLSRLPRMWGPEYRDIVMLFKKTRAMYGRPGMRQPDIRGTVKLAPTRVKHFGKCLSEEHWEETCDYYIKHFPKWRRKWQARKGKAIHTSSDFGRRLYDWEDVAANGVPL